MGLFVRTGYHRHCTHKSKKDKECKDFLHCKVQF